MLKSTSTDPFIDQIVANRFKTKQLIGRGSAGYVYVAESIAANDPLVAVKFLSHTLLDSEMRRRFAREAHICAQLGKKSPHIVKVMAYGVHNDKIPFYIMEYLKGQSLQKVINGKPLPLSKFFTLARQICLGLQVAHQGVNINEHNYSVIHRDIKPANILVTSDPKRGDIAKILDFGIAKLISDQLSMSQSKSFVGSLAYCSPEHMQGIKLDNRSDIYSLGAVMFEMLTGVQPWVAENTNNFGIWYKIHQAKPPRTFAEVDHNLKIPKELENLVRSCLAKDPSARPQSVAELLQKLELLHQKIKSQVPAEVFNSSASSLKSPLVKLNEAEILSPGNLACWQSTWPKNKPIAEIVFSHPVRGGNELLPAVWVMLPKQQIQKLQNDLVTIDNHKFVSTMSPHPMVLWLTVLYGKEHEPKWLPCYLDLKNPQWLAMTRLLAVTGNYRVLFFATEEPQRCAQVMTFAITNSERELLKSLIKLNEVTKSFTSPEESKKLLKVELEGIKPKMLMKLAANLGYYPARKDLTPQQIKAPAKVSTTKY